ncbi:hypothetical protein AX14_013831 [Amanita brunnescens Koide BX004]|nr:hypothetical protein AX14_013831 [Amanita brunnescens Koide BX004]
MHTMHAINTCNAAIFTDAGRQPFTAIQNLPNYSTKRIHIEADDIAGSLGGVQAVNSAENTPVATSPVLVPTLKRVKTINRLEGLAMLERRKARLVQDTATLASRASTLKRVRTVNRLEGLAMLERRRPELEDGSLASGGSRAQGSTLKRVRTINRLDGLAKLERRNAHIAREDFTIAFPLAGLIWRASTLKRVRTINKSAGLAMLGRRSAEDSDADSIVLAESDSSTLKRVRTVNMRAGQHILERRRARIFEKSSLADAQETEASS